MGKVIRKMEVEVFFTNDESDVKKKIREVLNLTRKECVYIKDKQNIIRNDKVVNPNMPCEFIGTHEFYVTIKEELQNKGYRSYKLLEVNII